MERWLQSGVANGRWMCFVDGENLTIRAQVLAGTRGFTLSAGKFWRKDVFVWCPGLSAQSVLRHEANFPFSDAIRTYYYASVVGDDPLLSDVRSALWNLGFHPEVFKKNAQNQKTKGVDITLSRDLLVQAFHNNFDVACLIAGDADYAPLISELKRVGKTVCVAFFKDSTSEALRLEADAFYGLDDVFEKTWRSLATP